MSAFEKSEQINQPLKMTKKIIILHKKYLKKEVNANKTRVMWMYADLMITANKLSHSFAHSHSK